MLILANMIIIFRVNYIEGPLSLWFVSNWSFMLFLSHISSLSLMFVTNWSFKLFWSQISHLSL